MIKVMRMLNKFLLIGLSVVVITIVSIYMVCFLLGPPPLAHEQPTIYYAGTGEILAEETGLEKRIWVDLDHISPEVIDATIAIEDQHFYEHHGFDLKRIIGALWKNITSFSLKEGASTITQQYARNLFLSHEKTWSRKIKEAFYTIRLEMFYTKEEILAGYLNMIYFGHGIYGIESASRYFFDKHADELSLAEAAMLIAIPKGPTYYSPLNNSKNANQRQQQILQAMLANEMISEQGYVEALEQDLIYIRQEEHLQQEIAPYFLDVVLQEAKEILQLDEEAIRSGGYQIHTTLDHQQQLFFEGEIKQIEASSDLQIATMAMDPKTGAILALIGGRDYNQSPFNRAIQAKRMAGSTFKPFLYYASLAKDYTPATTLLSRPTSFILENNEVYQPSNYNGYYAYEPITLAQALALSDNIYAVKTNLYLGPEVLIETARKFGIQSELPAVPSLALGTASVSLHEMVEAYSMLANGGYQLQGHTIQKIVDRSNRVVYERKTTRPMRILDERVTFILNDLLTGMFDMRLNGYTEVTGATIADQLSYPYAGKSGTTKADSWMIGYSPHLVVGVWTGYDDNRAIESAKERAYPKIIWANMMEKAHEDLPIKTRPIPTGIVKVPIDPKTGLMATPHCQSKREMYFIKGTEPKAYCHHHLEQKNRIAPPEESNDQKKKGMLERLFDFFM